MRDRSLFYSLSIFFYILALSGCASSPEKITSYKQNNVLIYSEEMSTKTPIHVHLFSTSETDLGRESSTDTTNAMIKSAPHLLAVDIVDRLRQSGFTQVTLDESAGKPSDNALNLIGRFTILNPGSQNLRLWIGFGAGKSKVCVEGQLVNSNGKTLTDFSLCRSGLGWGSSGPQIEGEAEILGHSIADFLVEWSQAGK